MAGSFSLLLINVYTKFKIGEGAGQRNEAHGWVAGRILDCAGRSVN